MIKIEFDYQQQKIVIQANLDDSFEEISQKYATKAQLELNKVSFLFDGRVINTNETINNIINQQGRKENKMSVLVISINTTVIMEKNDNKQSNDIICPICNELCKFDIKNYKITLYNCKNGHKIENIKLDEFPNYQNIDLTKIICDNCKKNNKGITFNNEFYKCFTCNNNLCPLCKSIHSDTHNIINYDLRNIYCIKHNKEFIKHCMNCNIDICSDCENEHNSHNIMPFSISFDLNKAKQLMNEFRDALNKFNNNIKEIIKKLNKVMENMEIFYNINNSILNNSQHIRTWNSNIFNYSIVEKELKNIKYSCDYGNNVDKLLFLYNEMEDKNIIIDMIYKPLINNNNKIIDNNRLFKEIRIFGKTFVDNNRNNCKIIYEQNEYNLTEYWNKIFFENNNADSMIFKFQLKGVNNITNMDGMFQGCISILSLPDLSKIDTSKVTNMSYMFSGCISLISLPDISNWNLSNVVEMSNMFSGCIALKSLPDLSKWSIPNASIISGMFQGCISLSSLPDISKWNTYNVTNMNNLFFGCRELETLPDLSKWNYSKVSVKKNIFTGCLKLDIPFKIKKISL